MLLKFKVGNFLSIGDKQELSMLVGEEEIGKERMLSGTIPTLRVSLVYGANSSGKSSIIRALIYARAKILGLDPINSWLSSDFKNIFNSDFSHIDSRGSRLNEDSYFEFMLETKSGIYSYGFEIVTKSGKIISEWLVKYSDSQTVETIYERESTKINFDNRILKSKLIFGKNKNDAFELFIKQFTLLNTPAKEIYDWFENNLIVRTNDSMRRGIITTDGFLKEMSKSISKYDTGIIKMVTAPMRDYPREIAEERLKEIGFDYSLIKPDEMFLGIIGTDSDGRLIKITNKNNNLSFEDVSMVHGDSLFQQYYKDESDGTKRLIDLMLLLSDKTRTYSQSSVYGESKLIVVDEIDRSMHINMTKKIINDFIQNSDTANCQLIATLHESHALPDLRRDEVWFVEKDENGQSILYSLEKFIPDYNGDVDKLYLEGRFGAIPELKPIRRAGGV